MTTALGKISFLDTPDVNGSVVITDNALTTRLTNLVVPGTGGFSIPAGTTAQRPSTPTLGESRFNTTLSKKEYWNGTAWISPGETLQIISGVIPPSVYTANSATILPYDNTVPTSTEGAQLWSQSFTPVLANSTILIFSSSFYTTTSTADIFVSGALFNGTNCFHAQVLGWTTNAGNGCSYTVVGQQAAGSTATRTYSFRAGPQVVATVYFGQSTTNQAFGTSTSTGSYVIMEIAP